MTFENEYTNLPINSDIRGIGISINDEDPVIILIESRVSYKLKIPKDEIHLIIQDPTIDSETFTLDELLNREISIFRTSNEYRILVKEKGTTRRARARARLVSSKDCTRVGSSPMRAHVRRLVGSTIGILGLPFGLLCYGYLNSKYRYNAKLSECTDSSLNEA